MKRASKLGAVPALMLAVAGCQQPATETAPENAAAANMSGPPGVVAAPKPAAPPAKPVKVAEKTDLLNYGFAYPADVAAIAPLASRIEAEAATVKADALKMAKEDRAAAKQSGFPFHGHELDIGWATRGQTPHYLSLLETSYGYTGGAHGMTGFAALLWDKEKARSADFPTMTDRAAFAKAIGDRFCKALNVAREKKRGGPVTPGDDPFTKCVDPMKQTLVATSTTGKAIDGLTVVIGAYEAGPYAEGSYDIPLPFDAAMLAAIRADYRPYFAQSKDAGAKR